MVGHHNYQNIMCAIMAVKEFVFDKKEISLTEFAKILKNNWQGYELLQAKVKKSPHKNDRCHTENI